MRRFEHGDHQCFVMSMDLDEALQSGLLRSHSGPDPIFSFFSNGRASYSFCQVCCHFAWTACDLNNCQPGTEIDDHELEERAVRAFRSAALVDCMDQEKLELIREVMTS